METTTAWDLDGPGGFTSAESDDVKADGCKSYGGGGWKIKRGGRTDERTERDGRYTARGGESGVKGKEREREKAR